MSKKAIVLGVAGQDGSYLSEHLLDLGYEVHGIVRRHSIPENQNKRIEHLGSKVNIYYGDLLDQGSLERLLSEIKPDLIFNLAAQSHVRISFDIPQFTVQTNAIGVINILEAYKKNCPEARFYQASSSECFGLSVDEDKYQRETTPMNPTSPYGCAKVFGFNITRHYRRAYGLHACNGILFNHTGPRRGSNFVGAKIVKTACQIKLGPADKLELGNMDSYRDFGHSKDYVKAMVKIINHDVPDDFVVATGETHSVREMCDIVFKYLDMDYKEYVVQNPKFLRPEELPYLRGDASKARKILGWEPEYTFERLMKEMVDHWMDVLQGKESLR